MGNRPPHPRVPTRRRAWRILLGLGAIALAVVVAGYFFGRRPIGEFFAGKLGERLAEDGVFIDWKSAEWLPGVGVRLHELTVYRDAAKQDRLARFGLVTARRPDPTFFRWDKMNFKAADTPLLLGRGAGETRLEHLDMRLLVQPGKADLAECHASLSGLRLEAKCAFAASTPTGNAEAIAAARQKTQREGLFRAVKLDWLTSIKEELKLQPEKDEPVLRMDLRSLPDSRGLESTVTFDGANFQWRGQRWDFVRAVVKLPVGNENLNSPFEFDEVRIGHAGREANFVGDFDPVSRVIRIHNFYSGIDLLALARAMAPGAVGGMSAVGISGAWSIRGAGEIQVDHLEDFRWSGDAAFDGEVTYASGGINLALQKPAFAAHADGRMVSISNLKAGLWGGTLDVAGMQLHWPLGGKPLKFETQLVLSGARSQSIVESFSRTRKPPGVEPVNWKGVWQIRAAGEVPMDHPGNSRLHGDLALDGDLVYASEQANVALHKPTFSMRLNEQAVTISDLKAGLWDGNLDVAKLRVPLASKEKNLRIETQLTLNGSRLQTIIDSFRAGRKPRAVGPLDWKGDWRIRGVAEVPVDQPGQFHWSGDAALDGEFVYASGQTNIALEKPTFSLRAEKQTVTLSDFKAGLWDGNLSTPRIQVLLPSTEKTVRFETQLTIDGARPLLVRKSFSGGERQPRVTRFNWKGAWRIDAAGEIPVEHPEKFHWKGDMAVDGDLVYASGKTKVALQKPTFSVRAEKQLMAILDFKAGLWGGSFSAPRTLVHLSSGRNKSRFETQFAIKDARLQSIVGSFGGTYPDPGIVQCGWTGSGQFDLPSLAGSGTLSVGEAEFCRMPIVGPLYRVFRILVPGFQKDEPSTMTVNHRVADGTLHLEELKLVSAQALIGAKGTVDLAADHAQLRAWGRLRRLPGLVTVLLTWLLEFKGEGPAGDLRWSFNGLPGFRPAINAPKKTPVTEEENEDRRAVKGLIELPGKVLRDE